MNENKSQQQRDQLHDTETERTHKKEIAASGTHDPNQKEKDSNVRTQADSGELGQSNTQTTDPGKLNRRDSL